VDSDKIPEGRTTTYISVSLGSGKKLYWEGAAGRGCIAYGFCRGNFIMIVNNNKGRYVSVGETFPEVGKTIRSAAEKRRWQNPISLGG
jgi:hypothetical protein